MTNPNLLVTWYDQPGYIFLNIRDTYEFYSWRDGKLEDVIGNCGKDYFTSVPNKSDVDSCIPTSASTPAEALQLHPEFFL
jgi:hypothetical protein